MEKVQNTVNIEDDYQIIDDWQVLGIDLDDYSKGVQQKISQFFSGHIRELKNLTMEHKLEIIDILRHEDFREAEQGIKRMAMDMKMLELAEKENNPHNVQAAKNNLRQNFEKFIRDVEQTSFNEEVKIMLTKMCFDQVKNNYIDLGGDPKRFDQYYKYLYEPEEGHNFGSILMAAGAGIALLVQVFLVQFIKKKLEV